MQDNLHIMKRQHQMSVLKALPIVVLCLPCLLLLPFLLPTAVHADGGFPIIGVLHAGSTPESIAVDTQTHLVYIAYEYPSLVVGFDPSSGKVRWKTSVGDSATDVQVDSQHHYVFATGSLYRNRAGILAILDAATGQTLLTAPTGFGDNSIAVDTKRQRVYVSSTIGGLISVFKLQTSPTGKLSLMTSQLIIGSQPAALGVNSRLGRLYVGDIDRNVVTVYDEDRRRILATIPVAEAPQQPLRVDEATGHVYIVCSTGQELDVLDGNTNTMLARIPVSPYPEGVAFNTATHRIYVADEGNKGNSLSDQNSGTTITVIDGQSFEVLGTLQVGRGPDGVEADPLLRRVYVAVEDSDAVVEISDSPDLPLRVDTNYHQITAIHRALSLLQQATIATLFIMSLTIIGAILGALSPRWRARGSLQNPPGGASSHSVKHIPLR